MRDKALSFLLLLPLFLTCSCASWRPSEDIDVSLTGLQFRQATMLETETMITIRVENENPHPLHLQGAVHKVYLNDVYLGKGMTSEPLEVPALGSATQNLTLYLRNLSMINRIRSIIESQLIEYRIKSKLYAMENGASQRLATTSSGRLDLREFKPSP